MSEVTHDGQGVFPPSAAGPAADGNAPGARQVIRSPEQVALDLSIAGPMSRVLAFSIDYGIILLIDVLLILGLMFLAAAFVDLQAEMAWLGELAADADGLPSVGGFLLFVFGLFILIEFAIEWGYFVLVEHLMQGRSPGKASLGGLISAWNPHMVRRRCCVQHHPLTTSVKRNLFGTR